MAVDYRVLPSLCVCVCVCVCVCAEGERTKRFSNVSRRGRAAEDEWRSRLGKWRRRDRSDGKPSIKVDLIS